MCCGLGVRHLQLFLSFLTLFCLFSNLNLIHLTSVLHATTPDQARAFKSLSNLHGGEGRFKREISSNPGGNLSSKWDDGHPIANDEDGKGPIPVEKVTTTTVRTTVSPTTFLFTNPPTTPSTAATTKSTPSMKWPETTTEKAEEEVTEEIVEDEVTQLINKDYPKNDDPKRDIKEEKSIMGHINMDTMLRLAFFICAGLGMGLACMVLVFLPHTINPAHIAFGALILSALVTGWQPFLNFEGAAVARMLQGLCVSFALPLACNIVTEWAPLRHRAFFLSILLLSYPASILGPWVLAQILFDAGPEDPVKTAYWVIYAIAVGLSVITAGIVLWKHQQYPHNHFGLTGVELNKIRVGKSKENYEASRASPNHRSLSFWIATTSFYGLFLALVFPSFYLPSILANPELMWFDNLGGTAATPYAGFLVLFFLASFIPYSPLSARIFNTLGLILTGIIFIMLPMILHDENPAKEYLLPLVLVPLGLLSGGVVHLAVHNCILRLLPSLGLSLFLAHLTAPLFVHLLVADNLRSLSWSSACTAVGILIAACCAPFVIAAKEQRFPPKRETTLRIIQDDEECGLTEMHELPPAGKHLT